MFFKTKIALLLLIFRPPFRPPQEVSAYSQGGPVRACVNMVPGHGVDPQIGGAPYTLEVKSNDDHHHHHLHRQTSIEVEILAENGQHFTGFMLQARNANQKNAIIDGIFAEEEDARSQTKQCNSDKPNTLTHRSAAKKSSISTNWTPPLGLSLDVLFRATIVKSKDIFWTEIDSKVVHVINGRIGNNTSFMVENDVSRDERLFSPKILSQKSEKSLNYSICEKRFCLGMTFNDLQDSNCVIGKSCDFLVSGGFSDGLKTRMELELMALISKNCKNCYFSMAFSFDSKMGKDFVVDCLLINESEARIGLSENIGQTNQIVANHETVLESARAKLEDRVISCQLTVAMTTTTTTTQPFRLSSGELFDPFNTNYHILMASGPLTSGEKGYHGREQRLSSDSPIDMSVTGAATVHIDTSPVYLLRIHGALMVSAWVGVVSVGTLLARHYKGVWVESRLCGVSTWFALHRALMICGLVLMVSAQISIFYYFDGQYRIGGHQVLGSLAFVLALLQPIGAALRPHPEAAHRWIFNWGHWLGGNSAHLCACAAIFVATNLPLADLPEKCFLWTMVAFVMFHVMTHVTLQLHAFVIQRNESNKQNKRREEDLSIALRDLNNSHNESQNGMGGDAPGSGFRRFVFGFYVFIVFGFVLTLISFISLPKTTLQKMSLIT